MNPVLRCCAASTIVWLLSGCQPEVASVDDREPASDSRPNVLVFVADDWSAPHAGAYGDELVATPNFDAIAANGVLFKTAFSASPSCTASRSTMLTGMYPHRLEAGGNLWGEYPERFPNVVRLLREAGYATGSSGKGWGPGRVEDGREIRDKNRDSGDYADNPAGPYHASFEAFHRTKPATAPFYFWVGSHDPHRPYEPGSGADAGIDPTNVAVPGWLPDNEAVQADIADYYFEVQRFDEQIGRILRFLEEAGELDNTLIVVTSDNGMPFPRAKANLYDPGTHVPLAMTWPERIDAGQIPDTFVNLIDLAPTLLDAAGLPVPSEMDGRSLLPSPEGPAYDGADRVLLQRERHAFTRENNLSYPMRGIRSADFLYIRNFRPNRWPAGDPRLVFAVGPYGDVDESPSKSAILDGNVEPFFTLAFAKRPAEELYDLRSDPEQLHNVAELPEYEEPLQAFRTELLEWMRRTDDARIDETDERWDHYPYYGRPARGRASQ